MEVIPYIWGNMETKICSKCKTEKLIDMFGNDKNSPDGKNYHCRVCVMENTKAYRKTPAGKESRKREGKAYNDKYKKEIAKKCAKYYQEHKDSIKERTANYQKSDKGKLVHNKSNRKYQKNNLSTMATKRARRRAMELMATVSYSSDVLIARKYRVAQILSSFGKTNYHVDHIIPLISPLVCGLHHEDNLQIITEGQNLRKSNNFVPILEMKMKKQNKRNSVRR